MKELEITSKIETIDLTERIKFTLLDLIEKETQDGAVVKLPKEEDLAKKLGISRNVLRDVLVVLEKEGYLSRRRSKGTIVNPHVVAEKSRLDLITEFATMIKQEGFTPSSKVINVEYQHEVDDILADESGYLKSERIFYADGEPVILCVDRIAGNVALRGKDYFNEVKTHGFFRFIQEYCRDTITCCLADITPILPSDDLRALLDIPENTPILCLEQRSFNPEHKIINHAHIYLRADKLKYTILRKRFL